MGTNPASIRWHGKVALVTDAMTDTGREICKALARRGLTVFALVSEPDKVEEINQYFERAGILRTEIYPLSCDLLLNPVSDVLEVFVEIKQRFPSLNVLINNAELTRSELLIHGTPESWEEMLTVNVFALSLFTREAVKLMMAGGSVNAHIININSVLGHVVSNDARDSHFYCATKHAVRALTEGLRQELRQLNSGIRVSQISLGAIEGDVHRFKALDPVDIVNAVVNILLQPPHVEINDIVIRATQQHF